MRPALFRITAGSLALAGCANAINLTHPAGPRYQGRFAPAAAEAFKDGRPVRIVTFNIKLGQHIDRAIAVLEHPALRAADVIALQEMDEAGVERIARELALNYVYFPATIHPVDWRFFGPAILTRWPIDSAWKLVLPHQGTQRGQRRTATAAIVRVGDRPVRVYAVHLENQTRVTREQHRRQAGAIVADAAKTDQPVIVAGDFNSEAIGQFFVRQGYRWPTARIGRTISFFSWDHIFTRGFLPRGPGDAGVLKDVRGASDHRPVWTEVHFDPGASGLSPASGTTGMSPNR